jgi:hypothetical protein
VTLAGSAAIADSSKEHATGEAVRPTRVRSVSISPFVADPVQQRTPSFLNVFSDDGVGY